MTSLQCVVAFAETVRTGGFSSAARELGLSPSAVAKSVARLERDFGLRLLHRTTRQVSLTGDGRSLYERCQRILGELEALRAEAEGVRAEPRGTLRVNMPVTYGRKVVIPVLARLARRHRELRFELSLSDHRVDPVREGLDAVVRIGRLDDAGLIARAIGEQQVVVLASPKYLAGHGAPATPADLGAHECMSYRLPWNGRIRPWEFREGRRARERLPAARFVLDDGEALVRAAVEGLGLIQVPAYMAADELQRERLVEVLADHRPAPMTISLLYARSRRVTPRLRVLIEALTAPARA
ncbi:MAG: LysR family transcriptional regulator [Gammaproteobacteria bacterium]|nr:LysR family transcriptional regulator [Gammaproteobacteria bacterium]